MRVVLQRVTSASVRVEGEVVGQIGKGLLCFVGIGRDDTEEDAEFCCRRLLVCPNAKTMPECVNALIVLTLSPLLSIRVSTITELPHLAGREGHAVEDVGALERLRSAAVAPAPAKEFFDKFCDRVRAAHAADKVAEGVFGAYMEVSLVVEASYRMTTAPIGYSRILPGTERPGHGAIHRSIYSPRNPIPPDPANPENPFVGLAMPEAESSFHSFQVTCQQHADLPCFGTRPIVNGEAQAYVWVTYAQVYSRVVNAGSGMMHLGLLPKVDTSRMIAIYMKNCMEWVIAEQAAYMCDAIAVALYDSLGPDSTEYILNQTELPTIVCTITEVEKLTQIRAKCPHLKNIIICGAGDDAIESEARTRGLNVHHLADVEREGETRAMEPQSPSASSIVTLMYTSGTTGEPKGVVLTHSNFLSTTATTLDYLKAGSMELSTSTVYLSYLPLAHIYERTAQVGILHRGGRIGFSQGHPLKIVDDVRALRPTLFCGVPRLLNRIYDLVLAKMTSGSKLQTFLFTTALSIKTKRLQKYGVCKHSFWDRIFFNKIAASLGLDRRADILPGRVPDSRRRRLRPDRDDLGVASSSVKDLSAGYVGGPSSAIEIKLVSVPEMNYNVTDREHGDERLPCMGRGEICMRGPPVFSGYYKQPEKTAEAFDDEGWLHTGDIGLWSSSGQLKIVDRKKNIFKLSQGEYVAPEKIEIALSTLCPTIAQLFVTGDSFHSHLVAIVVPEETALERMAAANGITNSDLTIQALCNHPTLRQLIQKELDDASQKAKLAGFERVRQIYLHHELFSIDGNELLTPTFKVKRAEANRHFKKQIDQLYLASSDSVAGKHITQT
ncbi:Long-chain-fatty-acid-coa ligase, partial [Globisporangium splendens]